MREIGRIVHEAAERDAVPRRQMLEHVPGADLVPLGRRVGDAVREEEEAGHAPRSASAFPRSEGRRHAVQRLAWAGMRGMSRGTMLSCALPA